MTPAAAREAQATACLEAAERFQPQLLALAQGLTGSKEEGMELFQQAALNCHDAIQTGGFEGERYEFYLRRAIKNLYYKSEQREQRRVPLSYSFQEGLLLPDEAPSEWDTTGGSSVTKLYKELQAPAQEPEHGERELLASQIMSEASAKFSFADRVAFRLHVDGLSCQQIAEHIGTKDQSWVWRRINRMKDQLRATFLQHWQALGE